MITHLLIILLAAFAGSLVFTHSFRDARLSLGRLVLVAGTVAVGLWSAFTMPGLKVNRGIPVVGEPLDEAAGTLLDLVSLGLIVAAGVVGMVAGRAMTPP